VSPDGVRSSNPEIMPAAPAFVALPDDFLSLHKEASYRRLLRCFGVTRLGHLNGANGLA